MSNASEIHRRQKNKQHKHWTNPLKKKTTYPPKFSHLVPVHQNPTILGPKTKFPIFAHPIISHTQINLPLCFLLLALLHQSLSLSSRQWLPLDILPNKPPFLFQFWIFHALYRARLRVHRRGTHPSPFPVEAPWPKRRILRFSKPDRPHRGASLRVTVLEIERQIGMPWLLVGEVERRGRFVARFRRFIRPRFRLRRWGFWGERRRGFKGVVIAELGVAEASIERCERRSKQDWFLAEQSDNEHEVDWAWMNNGG